jgi:hypothetical protein
MDLYEGKNQNHTCVKVKIMKVGRFQNDYDYNNINIQLKAKSNIFYLEISNAAFTIIMFEANSSQ